MYQHAELTPAMISRLEENPGRWEREEIERLIERVDAELDAVDSPDRL
ncbi:hypothetical protein [Bradyrhizobium japonicum]|nr:hypothetical protein [Bradyrhizobium japonicum]WLB23951.1 hypothetical protein QIH95_49205 [Bradyrhizobium japonicum]